LFLAQVRLFEKQHRSLFFFCPTITPLPLNLFSWHFFSPHALLLDPFLFLFLESASAVGPQIPSFFFFIRALTFLCVASPPAPPRTSSTLGFPSLEFPLFLPTLGARLLPVLRIERGHPSIYLYGRLPLRPYPRPCAPSLRILSLVLPACLTSVEALLRVSTVWLLPMFRGFLLGVVIFASFLCSPVFSPLLLLVVSRTVLPPLRQPKRYILLLAV